MKANEWLFLFYNHIKYFDNLYAPGDTVPTQYEEN